MLSKRLQIVLVIILVLIILLLIRQVKHRKLDLRYTLSWLFLAVALLIMAVFPALLNKIARLIGIYSPTNMIFFCGFGFSLIIIYTLTVAISKQSNEIKQLAQKIALMEGEMKDETKKNK